MHRVAQHRGVAEVERVRHALHLVRQLPGARGVVAQGPSGFRAALVATAAEQQPLQAEARSVPVLQQERLQFRLLCCLTPAVAGSLLMHTWSDSSSRRVLKMPRIPENPTTCAYNGSPGSV